MTIDRARFDDECSMFTPMARNQIANAKIANKATAAIASGGDIRFMARASARAERQIDPDKFTCLTDGCRLPKRVGHADAQMSAHLGGPRHEIKKGFVPLLHLAAILAPTLRKRDIVFKDNLRTHKIDGVRQAIEAVDAKVRYLPAYSPDLNPIEMAFSKLKTALRKRAARTVKTLMKLIGKLIKTFAPEQCANYFRHAGYA
ncbi:transposase [Bradyrhizobium septentrionale]|uniref:Transposase n=1 Tax=Bradyrhizobium septentrionale TaxID=1404411 RepID=A0ABZ2PBQ7_9BRAD